MKKITQLTWIFLIAAVLISACAPGVNPATNEPSSGGDQPGTPPTIVPTPYDAPIEPPEAAIKARDTLAKELNIDPEKITIAEIEETNWPDSCLGAGGPAEICAAVITPGFRVKLTTDGQSYELRTNLDGSVARQMPTALPDENSNEAAEKLAKLAGLPLESIRVVGSQPMDWPNACLGAAELGEACAEMIVPGYKFELESEGRAYFLHTNRDLSQVRLGGPEETLAIVKVRQQAAEDRNAKLEDVALVSSEAVQWRNSCLGVERDGMMCLMVITPGYRITVKVGTTTLEYHTNKAATAVVLYKP